MNEKRQGEPCRFQPLYSATNAGHSEKHRFIPGGVHVSSEITMPLYNHTVKSVFYFQPVFVLFSHYCRGYIVFSLPMDTAEKRSRAKPEC